jgi:hypothetical protein
MLLRGARCRCAARLARPCVGLAGMMLALALAGCGAVDTFRSLSGVNKNDPDPETAPFTQNLAAGEQMPYPNLASVPPPPTSATSTAERQKLTQTLVAERTETQSSGAPPPGLMPAAAPGQPVPAASSRGTASVTSAPTPAGPSASLASGNTAPGTAASGNRKANEPPEPLPLESSLQMPEVRSVPEPEKPRPALPAPQLQTTPARVVAVAPPPPETMATVAPAPAPPVPVMAEVPPPPHLLRPQSRRPAPVVPVAALELPGAAPRLDGTARAQVEHVAALYRDEPRSVRVVAYTSPPMPGAPGGEPLGSYHAALARAQVVSDALRAAGIPAEKVQAEAAPAVSAGSADRVDIQFAP